MRHALIVVAVVTAAVALPAAASARFVETDGLERVAAGDGQQLLDFGDAPGGGRPAGYGKRGRFPSLLANEGARASDTSYAFLGKAVTTEPDSRQVDRDNRDDGVFTMGFPRFSRADVSVLVTLPTAGLPDRGTAYLNLFYDWNRNGRWQGIDRRCRRPAPERAVQNRPIDLSAQAGREELYRVRFRTGRFVGPMWARAILTVDKLWEDPKGRGVFERGEVEDSLVAPLSGDEFACLTRTVEHGETEDVTVKRVFGFGPSVAKILSARLHRSVPPRRGIGRSQRARRSTPPAAGRRSRTDRSESTSARGPSSSISSRCRRESARTGARVRARSTARSSSSTTRSRRPAATARAAVEPSRARRHRRRYRRQRRSRPRRSFPSRSCPASLASRR